MNKQKIIEAIDGIILALQKLSTLFSIEGQLETTIQEAPQPVSEPIELLASKVAYAYSTKRPDFGVNKLFEDLKNMINGDKISYIITWMRKGNTEGIEGFLKLDRAKQRALLQKTLSAKEQEIKDILTKRFSHDN